MIDKIQITTNEFQIKDDSDLIIYQIPCKGSDLANDRAPAGGVLYEVNGRFVCGSKAVLNTKMFNLTIKPDFGMEVHWNPNKVMNNGNNFYQVSESEFRQSIGMVNKAVNDYGIMFNFDNASIVRLDIPTDREMQEPFKVYCQLFRMIKAKRADPKEFTNGYYFSNGNRELVFYGKLEEMRRKGIDVSAIKDKNIMRCEYRLRQKDAVRRFTGFNNIHDIRDICFDVLARFQQESIREFAFTNIPEPEQVVYSYKKEVDILMEFKRAFKRNSLARYHQSGNILDRYGSIDNYQDTLLAAGYHRSYVHRQVKIISRSIAIMEGMEDKHGKKSISTLYREVYDRFISSAA